MIPKIIFKYSWIYDQRQKEVAEFRLGKNTEYPSPAQIQNYIIKAEKAWRVQENNILSEISKIIGLKWKEKSIICYVVGNCIPFSDPLTLKVYSGDYDRFVDVLIHELIHRFDVDRTSEVRKYYNKKYKNESHKTITHIFVHAFHQHIYLKFFGDKRFEKEILIASKYPDYKRAWDIVKKEGYENIIKEFKRRLN